MLKIKDDVNLEELEKFGFKYCTFTRCYMLKGRDKFIDDKGCYYVPTANRHLELETQGCYCLDDIIYDLIQAGLVEKVEE